MSPRKLKDSLQNLQRAFLKLQDAVATPRTSPLVAEGTIQRFEFVIELFWKTLKRALEYEGRISKTPRESLKEAFQAGWIGNELVWLSMLDSRNLTSHLYLHPELVDATYEKIITYVPEMDNVLAFLLRRYEEIVSAG